METLQPDGTGELGPGELGNYRLRRRLGLPERTVRRPVAGHALPAV